VGVEHRRRPGCPRIERDGLAGFQIEFDAGAGLDIAQEGDQFVALIVRAGDVVAAAEVEPFEAGAERARGAVPARPMCAPRGEILLAQGVEMQAVDAVEMFRAELVDRESEPELCGWQGSYFATSPCG
jgi:hypothetical protein